MEAQGQREACLLEALLRNELAQEMPVVERLSIALGAVEVALTQRDAAKRAWPTDLSATVDALAAAFDGFVAQLATRPALAGPPAAKVKAVADAVWSKLNKGSYSKDLQHAQHVYNFAALLLPGGPPAGLKKQLDCAGVVTTTFAICQALALRCPQHADLAPARMQISEDHCWIQLDPAGLREGTVEITTDTAAKRGLPVAPDAWGGWLYTGGRAVLCTPRQALAALATSLNPTLTGGKKGVDSEELQAVQRRLLEALLEAQPQALYPAALCALADLREVAQQDALDAARDRGDAAELARLLQRQPGDPQDLFERAIRLASSQDGSGSGSSAAVASGGGLANGGSCTDDGSTGMQNGAPAVMPAAPAAACTDGLQPAAPASDTDPAGHQQQEHPTAPGTAPLAAAASGSSSESAGWQWYVYSYLAAWLARRAEFLASCADAGISTGSTGDGPAGFWEQAVATYREALEVAARGGAVLRMYRFAPATDDQLHKDVEGVLEEVVRDGLMALASRSPGGVLEDPALLAPLLLLWDGVCWLFSGKAKPSGWVALLMKVARLFSPEARGAAAAAVECSVSSGPMLAARQLWLDLKPVPLKPLFESADVGGGTGGRSSGDGGDGSERVKRARR